jgi:hypothetical protein
MKKKIQILITLSPHNSEEYFEVDIEKEIKKWDNR